jgi:hypothetical protein
MKGYNKPDKIEKGICFICIESCDFNAYVHSACAYAYLDEKERRIKEAKEKNVS